MVRRMGTFLAVLTLLAAMGGCSSRECAETRPRSFQYAIFNQYWNSADYDPVYRAAWPSTQAYRYGSEEVYFEERIIDREGLHHHHGPRHYRRFESVRTGHRGR